MRRCTNSTDSQHWHILPHHNLLPNFTSLIWWFSIGEDISQVWQQKSRPCEAFYDIQLSVNDFKYLYPANEGILKHNTLFKFLYSDLDLGLAHSPWGGSPITFVRTRLAPFWYWWLLHAMPQNCQHSHHHQHFTQKKRLPNMMGSQRTVNSIAFITTDCWAVGNPIHQNLSINIRKKIPGRCNALNGMTESTLIKTLWPISIDSIKSIRTLYMVWWIQV